MQILVTRKDRGNLLEKRILREINQANDVKIYIKSRALQFL